jgi:chemotaxis signal transduction protein
MFLSGELWENHPCCVVTVRDDLIDAHPDAVQEFTTMLVQAGQFIAQNPDIAAEIAVEFLDPEKKLGLKVPVLKNVLKEPQGIKTDDLFPVIEDLDRIQRYMAEEMGIGTLIDLEKFVDSGFAEVACRAAKAVRRPSTFHDVSKIVSKIVNRQTTQHATKSMLEREGKYLTFTLANEEYGSSILKIKEIIGMMPITPVPQTREFVKGVINLRGKVIPVVDLRLRFGIEASDYTERTCIIIVETAGKAQIVQTGVVVDSVSEVLYIKADEIDDTPAFGTKVSVEYILGMAKMEGGVKMLLDIDQIIGSEEMALHEQAA